MFARACIAVACIATFARCVAATFACAPAPVVSTRAGVVETIPLGATDAEDEDAPCRANTSATYVVVTLPARGRLSSTRARSPPSSPRPTFSHPACVHVHPVPASVHFLNRPGVSRGTPHPPARSTLPKPALPTRQSPTVSQETTLAYEAPTDTNAFSLPFDADARTAADPPVCRRVRRVPPRRRRRPRVASARSAVVRVHVIADPPTASPAIDAFPTSMTTLDDVAADVFLVGSADPAFVAATGTSSGSSVPGSGSGSQDWESREVAARDSTAVFLRVLVNPSHGWVYADGVLLRAGTSSSPPRRLRGSTGTNSSVSPTNLRVGFPE